ncbi:integrase [Streptomyces sp. PvR006]|nr:integrase [Streptomyces sp. PvR006]
MSRNVATLVEPPTVAAREFSPWSQDETLDFLAVARKDPLSAAFVLAIALVFRRGEVVGLRWESVDLDKREIRVRTQRQRVAGEVCEDDPKGRRRKQTLPLPAI